MNLLIVIDEPGVDKGGNEEDTSWLPAEVVDRITNGDDIDGDWQEANKHIKSFSSPQLPGSSTLDGWLPAWYDYDDDGNGAEMCTRTGRTELKHPVFRSGWSSIIFCDSVHTVELPLVAFLYFMANK